MIVEIVSSVSFIAQSIINSLSISSIISIVLVFFPDLIYRAFGSNVLWNAIKKSYTTDAGKIEQHFKGLENDHKLRNAVIEYFEHGIGIFGLYSSIIVSTISAIGLTIIYFIKLTTIGIGTSYINVIAVVLGISFTALCILLFFIFKRSVNSRGVHIYSNESLKKGLTKKNMQLLIIIINISLIIIAQIAEYLSKI